MAKSNVNIEAITQQFIEEFDDFCAKGGVGFDSELDRQIHAWYLNAPTVWPKRPYFSPSSSKSCPRELYMKATGAKRDNFPRRPHQVRWTELGTAIGDMMQRMVLGMERKGGYSFRFERNATGQPLFEDFAKTNAKIEHRGQTFYLYGTTDGLMQYINEDGEILRVGLEVKSKQSTPARTSLHSMREAEEGHRKQCVAYSAMYGVNYFIIVYVNGAKKSWNMTPEEYAANPDIRAFGIEITQADRDELFDKFAEITRAVNEGEPPAMDLAQYTFNNFKTACALNLSDEEFTQVKRTAQQVLRSSLPQWRKDSYYEAYEFIREVRESAAQQAKGEAG